MPNCPHCQRREQQVKVGFNPSVSQRYLCKDCRRKYTPERKPHGYAEAIRQAALQMDVDGTNLWRIARALGVSHPTVAQWVKALAAQLPAAPSDAATPLDVNELDELFTFVGSKKNEVYVVTQVDRASRCIVGWSVLTERTVDDFQAMVDRSPKPPIITAMRSVSTAS